MRGFTGIVLALTLVTLSSCAGNRPEAAPEPGRQPLPIRVVPFPGQTLLTRSCTGPYGEIDEKIKEFIDFIGAEGIETTGDLGGAFYDDPAVTRPEETRYEIRIPVASGTIVPAPYEVQVTPPMTTAAVLLIGDYEGIATLYPDIYEWIGNNGYEPAGPLMEIYLVHPGSGVPPEEYETEVHVPVVISGR